ncbi:hypothetical protein GF312_20195 [Candidatus Poribacteria bacterium]|nr:hypothetical protein [Candidatus Poribacteria bacterium]
MGSNKDKTGSRITLRSVILGLLLIPLACFWVSNSEMLTGVTEITSTALLIGAIFFLVVLILLNFILQKISRKLAFTSTELLVVYVMVTLAMAINGIGMFGFLTPALLNPFWYATPENEWEDFHPHIPSWFVPQNEKAIRYFYEGESSFIKYFGDWITPFVVWTVFSVVLLFMMLCLGVILRRRWMEQERLSFPIAAFPIEMTLRGGSISRFFKNKLLWIGFTIPAILQSINTLHFVYPSIPYIQFIKAFDLGRFITDRPWNAVGYTAVAFYPTVIGLTYLFPVDVSFSCAFFYLLQKGELVFASAMGLRGGSGLLARFPSVGLEGAGAWLALGIASLWMARRHLVRVFKKTFIPRRSSMDDSNEPLPYRWAVFGLIGGMIFMVYFVYMTGASLYLPFILFGIFFTYMITLSRIRAQTGGIWNFGPTNPPEMVVTTLGTRRLGPTNLTILSYLMWFNLDYRCAVMPHQMEGFKIGREAKMNMRKLCLVIILALIVGVLVSYVNVLRIYYLNGADTARINPWRVNMGKIPYQRLHNWFNYPQPPDYTGLVYVLGGALMVWFLAFMSTRYVWWVFHPVGYAYASTHGNMFLLWSGMLACSAIKWIILRTGGVKAYRKWLPLFIGLLLGDYVIASIWSIIGTVIGMPMYRVFPN